VKLNRGLLALAGVIILAPVAAAGIYWSKSESSATSSAPANNPAIELNTSQLPVAEPIHPDEPLSDTQHQRFSLDNSITRVEQVAAALDSFRQLTDTSKTALGEGAIATVENTDWETQNLGFHNWMGAIEGTLWYQNYTIKKLEYELARKQFEDGEISKTELERKASTYDRATQDLQAFLNSFSIVD
jgi:hypothetical protein